MKYITSNSQPASVEQVFRDVRKRILNMDLEPGQKISENQMCEEYGVSRSIIRNVFTRLNQLGLLTIYPQRGTYVSLIDVKFIEDLIILRTAVEKEVLYEIFKQIKESNRLELVEKLEKNLELQENCPNIHFYNKDFRRLDSQFHYIMVDSVKRSRLMKILEDPMLHIDRWRNFDVAFDHRLPTLIDQHRAIVNAIKENNLNKAQEAIAIHLESTTEIVGKAKEKYQQYFIK